MEDIYFAGSIHGGRTDAELYKRVVEKLKTHGNVLTEHVSNWEAQEESGGEKSSKGVFERDMKLMDQAEFFIAECTQPSLGVGFEIATAKSLGKKILCLYRPSQGKELSAMVRGLGELGAITLKEYKETELDGILKQFFEENAKNGGDGNVDEKVEGEAQKQ